MSALNKPQSTNWNTLKDSTGFIEEGFPFREGFPATGPSDNTEFALIFRNGERLRARVDFSTQYRAEGLRWEITAPPDSELIGWRVGQQAVAAWSEIQPETEEK